MIYQAVLKDPLLEEQLTEQGYVVIPFLKETEVQDLVSFYFSNNPVGIDGMYATAHAPDVSFRIKMNEHIRQVFARAISEVFVNCSPLGGSYVVKGKGSRGTLNPHQDWNIVDEQKYRSFNIWVPLVDLNKDNGAIQVLPKSHAWLQSYRSANISSAYEKVYDLIWDKMAPLFMKKGEALIYDHRLLHASGENRSEELRLASVYGIIPEEAQMYYYHRDGDNTVEVYESNPDFFLYQNIFEGPKGLQKVGSFSHDFYQPDESALTRLISGIPVSVNSDKRSTSFFAALRNLLNLRG
jgi:hypothetical protein